MEHLANVVAGTGVAPDVIVGLHAWEYIPDLPALNLEDPGDYKAVHQYGFDNHQTRVCADCYHQNQALLTAWRCHFVTVCTAHKTPRFLTERCPTCGDPYRPLSPKKDHNCFDDAQPDLTPVPDWARDANIMIETTRAARLNKQRPNPFFALLNDAATRTNLYNNKRKDTDLIDGYLDRLQQVGEPRQYVPIRAGGGSPRPRVFTAALPDIWHRFEATTPQTRSTKHRPRRFQI